MEKNEDKMANTEVIKKSVLIATTMLGLKDIQKKVIIDFVFGWDVIAALPNGYGKGLCLQNLCMLVRFPGCMKVTSSNSEYMSLQNRSCQLFIIADSDV